MKNSELQLAEAFIEETDRHLFLTGKAGTGKTTFLRRLRQNSPKRMVVTAPTGVAAVNARGVTLHSFFQLPLGPLTEGRDLQQISERARRFSKAKRRLLSSLDLLVIDEISMVRADVLDGVDEMLRRLRRNQQPFGGVQLLMIGDLGQLAPIVKDEEKEILRRSYDSPFFFSSRALQRTDWLTIELRHVYRQTDRQFIDVLNRIRDGKLDDRSMRLLESRYRPDFKPPDDEGWIILSTHNHRVDAYNRQRLERLPGKTTKLLATVDGSFPPSSSQAPEELELKVGAQVVFLRNDTSRPPRYFNGKVATVTSLSSDEIRLRGSGDGDEICLQRATWDHVSYRLDEKSGEIREQVLGSFTQFPLRLAWAMTIHKSQGLTFERAAIDAGKAFAPGQVYVALSRCKSLDGLVLISPISPRSTRPDPAVAYFLNADAQPEEPIAETLSVARIEYRWRILSETFDFSELGRRARALLDQVRSAGALARISNDQISDAEDLTDAVAAAQRSTFAVSEAFLRELGRYREAGLDPVDDALVGERIEKATEYFSDKIRADLEGLTTLQVMSDNREIEGRVRAAVESLRLADAMARAGLGACRGGYEPARVVRARTEAASASPPARPSGRAPIKVPQDTPHRELVERLLAWRVEKARSLGDASPNTVIHQRVAFAIAAALPAHRQALKRVLGVGPKTLENYGEDLLTLVGTYRREQGLEDGKRAVPVAEGAKSTRQVSLDMFRAGSSVQDIAEKRELATVTIEGHLATFVESGELEIDEVLSQPDQEAIGKVVDEMPEKRALRKIYSALGRQHSYGAIKIVQAHRAARAAENDDPDAPETVKVDPSREPSVAS